MFSVIENVHAVTIFVTLTLELICFDQSSVVTISKANLGPVERQQLNMYMSRRKGTQDGHHTHAYIFNLKLFLTKKILTFFSLIALS